MNKIDPRYIQFEIFNTQLDTSTGAGEPQQIAKGGVEKCSQDSFMVKAFKKGDKREANCGVLKDIKFLSNFSRSVIS
jgi:hypothetical protein